MAPGADTPARLAGISLREPALRKAVRRGNTG